MMKKGIALAAAMVFASAAQADLKNVSATGLSSNSQGFIACTIVDEGTTLLSGGVLLLAFAESRGNGDPAIRVWSLHRDLAITNDNWRDGMDFHAEGQTQRASLRELDDEEGNPYRFLRNPNGVADAAVVFPARPGEAVCAESKDKISGELLPVSVSITDMNAILFLKSAPSITKTAPVAAAHVADAAALEQMLQVLSRWAK